MVTKGYGFTVEDIDESCPADLEPYELAHEKEIEERDNMQYLWWGYYAMSAIGVSLEHCFSGKKAKSKYIEKPYFSENKTEKNEYVESQEEVAIFEMKQRIEMLREKGLPESPM